MSHVAKPEASPPFARRRAVAGLLVFFVGWLVIALVRGDLGGDDPSANPMTRVPLGLKGPESQPVQLHIVTIKVAADVTRLGLNDDRTVEVPQDPDDVGWYRLGPSPGQPGSAVILGHVDSKRGPAVFSRLWELEPGDRVTVRLAGGSVARFEVTRVVTYPIKDFPARKVYGPPVGDRPALNLVTCGGEYDKSAGGYQANVVVYTSYVGATGAGHT